MQPPHKFTTEARRLLQWLDTQLTEPDSWLSYLPIDVAKATRERVKAVLKLWTTTAERPELAAVEALPNDLFTLGITVVRDVLAGKAIDAARALPLINSLASQSAHLDTARFELAERNDCPHCRTCTTCGKRFPLRPTTEKG